MGKRATGIDVQESATARRDLLASAFRGELPWSEALVRMRLSLGKTQAEFGQMFGLTRQRIVALEGGKINPTVGTLMRISRPFGLTVGFVPRADVERPQQLGGDTINRKKD
jgi:transcriptional regulator with XRE-family HTH domain